MLKDGGTSSLVSTKIGDQSYDRKNAVLYGNVSAVHAQAAGAIKFLENNSGTLQNSISSITFDDSQTWVKDPASKMDRELGVRVEGARTTDGKLWKRGKNISLATYNSTETLFTRRCHVVGESEHEMLRAAVIHSPAQILPAANTATIADRRDRWLAMGVSGPGSKFNPGGLTAACAVSRSWHSIISCKDNLHLNDCIMGMDERILKDRLAAGTDDYDTVMTLLSLSCCAHSVVLSTKLVTDRMDNLPGKLVKMGHLHESGKVSAEFQGAITDVVTKNFKFDPVDVMPAESESWRSKAAFVLRKTRACNDLTEQDEAFILSMDNGDWDSEEWRHFCIGPACVCAAARQTKLYR
jgi:hypothetical protein